MNLNKRNLIYACMYVTQPLVNIFFHYNSYLLTLFYNWFLSIILNVLSITDATWHYIEPISPMFGVRLGIFLNLKLIKSYLLELIFLQLYSSATMYLILNLMYAWLDELCVFCVVAIQFSLNSHTLFHVSHYVPRSSDMIQLSQFS